MTTIDIGILAILAISTLVGLIRGLTKELLSLFTWGGAAGLTYFFLPLCRVFVHPYIANPMIADCVTMFAIFVVGLVILSMMANVISMYIHESSFKGIDHSLGLGFGIVRGVMCISAIELLFSTFTPRHAQSHLIQTSRFIPMVRNGGDMLFHILPLSTRSLILAQAEKVENQAQTKIRERLKREDYEFFTKGNSMLDKEGNQQKPSFSVQDPGEAPAISIPSPMPGYGEGRGQTALSGEPYTGQKGEANPAAPQVQGSARGTSTSLGTQTFSQDPSSSTPFPQSKKFSGNKRETNPAREDTSAAMPSHLSSQPLGQVPQDTQSMVDKLSRLNPEATAVEEGGYTIRQREDMTRLFQTVKQK